MTMLDVGANIGYFSLIAARLIAPKGAVWAFEPVRENLGLLQRNAAANGLTDFIHVSPVAVSDVAGVRHFYINSGSMGLSSLNQEASTGGRQRMMPLRQEVVEVVCTTLDDWAKEHGWPTVQLVKIDVEGAEPEVLTGMVGLTSRNPGMRVIIEFNVRTLRAANKTVDDFLAALRCCGLVNVYAIGPKLRPLRLPADVPWLLRTVRRHGGESANLLCMSGHAAERSN